MTLDGLVGLVSYKVSLLRILESCIFKHLALALAVMLGSLVAGKWKVLYLAFFL